MRIIETDNAPRPAGHYSRQWNTTALSLSLVSFPSILYLARSGSSGRGAGAPDPRQPTPRS